MMKGYVDINRWLIGYLVFVFFISLMMSYTGIAVAENLPKPPEFPELTLDIWHILDALTFPIKMIIFFYSFVFITSAKYPWLSIIFLPSAIILTYYIITLIIELAKAIGSLLPFT